jgi:hypothetical protein
MSALYWFRAGAVLVVLEGILHFIGRLIGPLESESYLLARAAMQANWQHIFGMNTSLYAIHESLDWSFTLFSLFVGALNLAAAESLAATQDALRRVVGVNVVGLAALVAASVVHGVVLAAFVYSLAAALFLVAALRASAERELTA